MRRVFQAQFLDFAQPQAAMPEQIESPPVEQGVAHPAVGACPFHLLFQAIPQAARSKVF
jgi:hypothetical protein